MTLFNQDKGICSDKCWREYKDWQNSEIANYMHYNNNLVECENPKIRMPNAYLEHTNLRGRPGYGWSDSCLINNDSMLRNDPRKMTHDRCNIQLDKRIFYACPSLLRGQGDPSKELEIISGSDSDHILPPYTCKKQLMEKTQYDMIPLLGCMEGIQDPQNIIEPWTRGGADTRSYRSHLQK